ncbi:MAG: hypothetical protein EKK64_10270 [Neisseriaceae bacterium]|nr:MAG: hypothetical protein EKK64_10270 [Neisseriaceae bacterium]
MELIGLSLVGIMMTDDLLVISEFLTEQEEFFILSNLKSPIKKEEITRNNVYRYGSKTPYGMGNISVEIPDYLQPLIEKVVKSGISEVPKSVSVNEYMKGQSLSAHIDSQQAGPVITIVSLASSATMRFSKDKEESFDVELLPRSLIRMKGDIRKKWKHEILPLLDTRYSIVFRCV